MQSPNIITPTNSNQPPIRIHTTQKLPQSNICAQDNVSFSNLFALRGGQGKAVVADVGECPWCRKYESERGGYERTIAKLGATVVEKDKTIHGLEQHIRQLKNQEEYLMSAIQAMRDRNSGYESDMSYKLEKVVRMKEQEVKFGNKQIAKLKQWLKQQKTEVFRSLECIKIKDIIIQNLQKQLKQAKNRRKQKKLESSIVTSESQPTNSKLRQKQLQSRIDDLISQVNSLRNVSSTLKQQLHRLQKQHQFAQPLTPILKLKQFSKNSNTSGDEDSKLLTTHRDRPCCTFLSKKCLGLEIEIQSILGQMEKLKEENRQLHRVRNKALLA